MNISASLHSRWVIRPSMKSLKLRYQDCVFCSNQSYGILCYHVLRTINLDVFGLQHNRLSHPRATILCRIIENSRRHLLKNTKVLMSKEYTYETCSQGNLITRPSITKIDYESLYFLQKIQVDIYGLIHLKSGTFRYFMVLTDASKQNQLTQPKEMCLGRLPKHLTM